MAGPGNVHNAYKFETNDHHEELGLNLADFNARQYDYQIGRFTSIDPLADGMGQEGLNPYHFGADNPANFTDPWGLARGEPLMYGGSGRSGGGLMVGLGNAFTTFVDWLGGLFGPTRGGGPPAPWAPPADWYYSINTDQFFSDGDPSGGGGGGSAGGGGGGGGNGFQSNGGDDPAQIGIHRTTTDAGHGVNGDHGANEGENYESDYALNIESATDFYLRLFGFDNSRTRTTDVTRDDRFSWRYGTANDNNSEAFISFHLNGGTTSDKVYAIYQQGKSNEEDSKNLGISILKELSTIMSVPANGLRSAADESRFTHLAVLNNFNGEAGILIEFGSIQSVANRNFINQNANLIGFKVALAVYKYFYHAAPPFLHLN